MSPPGAASTQEELRLGVDALRAADALLAAGLPADAMSRAYYAAFHAARALLFSIGLEPRSHEAVKTLFAREFVKTGKVPAERSRDLAQLEALRLSSDYDPAFALGVDLVRLEVEKARRFVEQASALLLPPAP